MRKTNYVNPKVMYGTIGLLVVSLIALVILIVIWFSTEDISFKTEKKNKDSFEAIFSVEDEYEDKINSIADSLVAGRGLSDYEAYKVLHDWVASYIDYNYDALTDDDLLHDCNNPEYCLDTGWAVCGGYASLYEDLCEAAGLYCDYVHGKADFLNFSGIGHAWNIVKVGGKYYHLDVCCDDTSTQDGSIVYDWFFQGSGYVTNSFRTWDGTYDFEIDSYNIIRSTLEPYNVSTRRE